jgi:hypothetical protein
MKLPLKLLEKREKAEYYLALVLQNEKVISIIFEKQGGSIKYISSDEEYFKDNIEDATIDEFLDVLDKVITTSETALPENIETHKTIFGLKDNWIEDDKIKKEYLERLKKAKDELTLEPIGFLAFSESLINLMQKEEGAPITAILVNVGKKYLTVYWIKAGKILETRTSEIHESASFTADTLMKHFENAGNLPAKVVIFDSDEDELTQEFIGHQWSKSLSFLHLPQIASLPEDAATKAMLLGAATQMNTQLIYDYSKNIEDQSSAEKAGEEDATKSLREEIENPKDLEEITSQPTQNIVVEEEQGTHINMQGTSPEYFGFVEGADVTKTAPVKSLREKEIPSEIREESIQEIPDEIKMEMEEKTPLPINIGLVTEKIKVFVPKMLSIIKKIKLNKNSLSPLKAKNKLLLIIPVALLLLILGIFYIYLFKTTVQINVYVNPKSEQKSADVTFSSATNIADKTLAFETVSVSEDGTTSTSATGKKYIGDKAKGAVTIFNNSDSPINLSAGTTITSSNNLDYTIDKDISVASASGDIFSGTKPGTGSVSITASDIGQDYNLPSGTKFSIGSNSNIAAKNDNALSGGTKKSITVVSDADLNKLLADLPASLEQKARDDLKSKATSEKTIISQFISETVDSKSFNKKSGDESSNVNLNGTVSFKAISYLNKDMEDFANSLFSSDEKIMSDNLTVAATNIKLQKNENITANLSINAKLMPKVNIEDLRKQIAGYSNLKATNTLSNLSQAQEVNIVFNPNIPLLPKNLPGDYKKIFINITSK